MININLSELNKLEESIHKKMLETFVKDKNITITDASKVCNVSPSKISKYVRKLGFDTYKEYKRYFTTEDILAPIAKSNLSEAQRIYNYISNFDNKVVESFLDYFDKYDKIIIYGEGPSFIAAEYFACRLQIVTNKFIITAKEEHVIKNTADKHTLVVIITATGIFSSYKSLCEHTLENKNELIFIIEEYRYIEEIQNCNLFYLTKTTQANWLKPFEKSRTLFFIFFEEVIQQICKRIDNNSGSVTIG